MLNHYSPFTSSEFYFYFFIRRYSRSLHARIEQWNNQFSFDSHDPSVYSSTTVTGLIEHYKVWNMGFFIINITIRKGNLLIVFIYLIIFSIYRTLHVVCSLNLCWPPHSIVSSHLDCNIWLEQRYAAIWNTIQLKVTNQYYH